MVSIASRRRFLKGLLCWATFLVAPLGWFVRGRYIQRCEPERMERGLVLIYPGIEGRSFLNIAILQGLLDAGVESAIEIVDWTTGNKFLALYHLRSWRRNLRIAQSEAERIVRYQQQYPDRPVWIVGHSGGAGMAVLVAEALPATHKLQGIVLLAGALSPGYDLRRARAKCEQGMWSFHSLLDWLFVGVGTTLFGTIDGRHGPGAGMLGFRPQPDEHGQPCIVQTAWTPREVARFNLGGHFGCVHRVFIAETVGALLVDGRGARKEETQSSE